MERKEVIGKDGLKHCSICGERTEMEVTMPLMDGFGTKKKRKVACMCKCRRDEAEAEAERLRQDMEQRRVEELRNLSLIDAKSRDVNFNTYRVNDENRRVFNLSKRYVEKFEDMYKQSQGLLFWGGVGTGKSYTAAAIANELIDRRIPVIMTSFVKLLNEMQDFENNDTDYIRRLNRAKLLIIDDLGTERGTDFALEKVYDIIDSRYRSGKPAIFTTNLTMKHMKDCTDTRYNRIYDRIFEMCYPVKFDGLSWRKKDAAERYDYMHSILED